MWARHRALEINWRLLCAGRDYGLFIVIAVGAAALFLIVAPCSIAQTSYYRHTFFDDGPRTSTYFYSFGKAVEPSTLETHDKKLPLSSDVFFTPPNSLRISWRSNAGGSWAAQIK